MRKFAVALNLNLINPTALHSYGWPIDKTFHCLCTSVYVTNETVQWDLDTHPFAAWSPSWLCPGLLQGYSGSYSLPDQHWLDWYRCWSSEIWIGIIERPGCGCPAQRPPADWSSPPALTDPSSLASERQTQFIAGKTW